MFRSYFQTSSSSNAKEHQQKSKSFKTSEISQLSYKRLTMCESWRNDDQAAVDAKGCDGFASLVR